MSKLDEQLDALFRSLPRERAAADFTQRFLLRYAEQKNRSRFGGRFVLAVATAAAAVAISFTSTAWYLHHAGEKERMMAEYRAIREDYVRLVKQHDSYHRDLVELTVLHLGGDGESELVLDLSDLEGIENVPVGGLGEDKPLLQTERGPLEKVPYAWPRPLEFTGGSI